MKRLAQVLDVGSGSGFLSAALAQIVGPQGGRVVGVELVPELVEMARAAAAAPSSASSTLSVRPLLV